jgi:inactivated superfamily I helicase
MALITFEAAVNHLRQNGVVVAASPEEPAAADLLLKMEQASALVVAHLKRPAEWAVDDRPEDDPEFAIVQAAVLKVLGNLYRVRGDDEQSPAPVSADVVSMLSLHRDPTLA